ncbi:emerin (Emery-Dreifuss muscular dystrophy) [Amia ocellicauda]|uniref:emerin (Emery-Dreifuss muscular dystrophy) n=1 Tax=Amia ocellicauda TaxID=2972642 RepID=UPI0034641AE8
MAALSNKSDKEIRQLLDQYGIKHGPIVESTQGLYEKKLQEAMAKDKKVKTSSDKTYYREEQEEVTYLHYRQPIRNDDFEDDGNYSSIERQYTTSDSYREPVREYEDSGRQYSSTDSYSDPRKLYGNAARMYFKATEATPRDGLHSRPVPTKSSAGQTTRSAQEKPSQESRLIPLWLQILAFLLVASFLYYVFTSMETPEQNPFNKIN